MWSGLEEDRREGDNQILNLDQKERDEKNWILHLKQCHIYAKIVSVAEKNPVLYLYIYSLFYKDVVFRDTFAVLRVIMSRYLSV